MPLLLFCLPHFVQFKLFAFSGGIELGTKETFREDSQHPAQYSNGVPSG